VPPTGAAQIAARREPRGHSYVTASSADQPIRDPARVRRERVLVFGAVTAPILFRSAIFVFGSTLSFDSDEAVFGLMGKHLAEGRAFPLFMYGQSYILAVEAWLAAPIFLLFGVSIPALKLPLLAVNLATGILLVWLLEREVGLRPVHGFIASLFFVLAPPGTVGTLLSASGGNPEPFLYVLLLWMTQRRPVWFGLIAGLGFLHREFTVYAVAAILVLDGVAWARGTRVEWRPLFRGFRVAAEAWLVVQVLRPVASAAGPGTTIASIPYAPPNNLLEVLNRSCFEVRTMVTGVGRLVDVHWPRLFGTDPMPVRAFGLDSRVVQGLPGLGLLLGGLVLVMVVRIAMSGGWAAWWSRYRFCAYLVILGGLSAAVYVVARCGTVSPLRYDLLSIIALVGLTGWFLAVERRTWLRRAAMCVVVLWAGVSGFAHARIWTEYVPTPRVGAKTIIVRTLDSRRIRYASADYWIAYYVTFLSAERIIVASEDVVRIQAYNREVAAHHDQAVRVSRAPCPDGSSIAPGLYLCPYR
jgi:hypothetical protein